MRFPAHRANGPRRLSVRAAWYCLLAALFLQVPSLTAALAVSTGVCCTGDQCPIAAHHHHQAAALADSSPTSAEAEGGRMDCNHDKGHSAGAMHSCSMSCCHTPEQLAVHAHVFVLSAAIASGSFAPLAETISALRAGESSSFLPPLSPPPKSLQS